MSLLQPLSPSDSGASNSGHQFLHPFPQADPVNYRNPHTVRRLHQTRPCLRRRHAPDLNPSPSFSPQPVSSLNARSGKLVSEMETTQIWDPGGAGKPISSPFKLIHGVRLKSSFCFFGRCQKDDECWYYAKDEGSFVKSGHWGLKNLKDAESSIPSSPSNKPKRLNQIWKSIAICWSHLS